MISHPCLCRGEVENRFAPRRVFCEVLFLFGISAAWLASPVAAQNNEQRTYDRLADLADDFSNHRIGQATPVDFQATLTYCEKQREHLFVQSGDVGFYFQVDQAEFRGEPLKCGSQLRVQGVFNPRTKLIEKAVVTVEGEADLPEPLAVSIPAMAQWEHTSRWVQAEGVVEQVAVVGARSACLITLRDQDTPFVVRIVGPVEEHLHKQLLGARLRVLGTLGGIRDDSGQLKYYQCLLMDASQLQILEKSERPQADAERRRIEPLEDILSDPIPSGRRVRVHGRVEAATIDSVNVKDATGAVRIFSLSGKYLEPDMWVEVAGRVEESADGPLLHADFIRVTGFAEGPVVAFTDLAKLKAACLKDQISESVHVDVEAILTYRDPNAEHVFVQEGEVGLYVLLASSMPLGTRYKLGNRVRITGVVNPSSHRIVDATMANLGEGELPPALPVSISEISPWAYNARLVRMTGKVEQVAMFDQPEMCVLVISDQDNQFVVRVDGTVNERLVRRLPDSRIQVEGVLSGQVDEASKLNYRLCFVGGASKLRILSEAERGQVDYEDLKLGQLVQLRSESAWLDKRVRLRARVSEVRDFESITVKDERGEIRIPSLIAKYFKERMQLEVEGLVNRSGEAVSVAADLFRVGRKPALHESNLDRYTNLAELRAACSNDLITRPTRVDLVATLTYWDPALESAFVQDAGAGLRVKLDASTLRHRRQDIGNRVRVTGVVEPGQHQIGRGSVTAVGEGDLPTPLRVSVAELLPWQHGARWVRTSGTVEQIVLSDVSTSPCQIVVHDQDSTFVVCVNSRPDEGFIRRLPGSRIEVEGVLSGQGDEFTNSKYRTCYAMDASRFRILEESGRDEVGYRRLRDGELSSINADPAWSGRSIGFQAQVGHVRDFEFVTVEDTSGAVRVPTLLTKSLNNESLVDVCGHVNRTGSPPSFIPDVIRVVDYRRPRPPIDIRAGEVDSLMESRRIRVAGQLEQVITRPDKVHELVLRDGHVSFRALFTASDAEFTSLHLDQARVVSVAGLAEPNGASFSIETKPADVRVASRYFKVDSKLAVTILVAVLGVLALGFVWARVLRSQVTSQTKQISQMSSQLVSSFDSIQEGILTLDSSSCLTSFNKRVDEMLGVNLRVGEGASATFDRIARSIGNDIVFQTAWREASRDPGSRAKTDIQVRTDDGRHFDIFSAPIFNNENEVIGRLWRFDDVTEKHELEDRLVQSQKMEAVGRLAGGIAHDFNNHLMAITTNLCMAKRNAKGENTGFLEAAEHASDRAADLVSQLLGFSRKSPIQRSNQSLSTIVNQVVSFLRRSFNKSIEIETRLDPDLGRCDIDATRIEQVLINICINARDSLPLVGGRIRISTRNVDEGEFGKAVQVLVEDNGHGMTDDVRAKIFEPFFTTKEPGKGTGLGLAMSYGIVEQHGGQLECSSTFGHGSRFTITLPRNDTDEARADVSDSAGDNESNSLGGDGHILLADDEAMVRASVEALLGSFGYRVFAVSNGQEAVDAIEAGGQFDAVLLDLTMPVLSGRQAFQVIADRRPDLPVAICSGHLHDINEFNSPQGRKPAAILTKPCNHERLLDAVRKMVKPRAVS